MYVCSHLHTNIDIVNTPPQQFILKPVIKGIYNFSMGKDHALPTLRAVENLRRTGAHAYAYPVSHRTYLIVDCIY